MTQSVSAHNEALDRARHKAYRRLIPLLFVSYVIAYIDRVNVAFAKLTMSKDMPAFDNDVIGTGAGLFFLGYFLLEIPGTLMVERFSARKIIARIMISWGIIAGLTAFVTTPAQFYGARFLLGLAEAGFFPGVIIFLTRWFPARDRARALALFLMATPIAQVISPLVCNPLLKFGLTEVIAGKATTHALLFGLHGWQLVFLLWGFPAVALGILVLFLLADWPRDATWLSADEKLALQTEIDRERAARTAKQHMTLLQALRQPKVLLLALAYFFVVTANYGTEFFLPSILERWFRLKLDTLTVFMVVPPIATLGAQWFVGYSSDRTRERRLHTAIPIALGALTLALTPFSLGSLPFTMLLLIFARTGIKAYQPAFWTLPSLFLSSSAAAGCVGFINSVGNLGGFVGPKVLGKVEKITGSFSGGIWFLSGMMLVSTIIILTLGLGKSEGGAARVQKQPDPAVA
ncbi:MAG TPA: MFS transporter [Polyangiaceae bacterium]|nr:MFS transporter [Polyangiaceae bacterium]